MDLAVKDFPASMKLDGVTFYRRSYSKKLIYDYTHEFKINSLFLYI